MKQNIFDKLSQLDRIEYMLEKDRNNLSLITPSIIWYIIFAISFWMIIDIFAFNYGIENWFLNFSPFLLKAIFYILIISLIGDLIIIVCSYFRTEKFDKKYKK